MERRYEFISRTRHDPRRAFAGCNGKILLSVESGSSKPFRHGWRGVGTYARGSVAGRARSGRAPFAARVVARRTGQQRRARIRARSAWFGADESDAGWFDELDG